MLSNVAAGLHDLFFPHILSEGFLFFLRTAISSFLPPAFPLHRHTQHTTCTHQTTHTKNTTHGNITQRDTPARRETVTCADSRYSFSSVRISCQELCRRLHSVLDSCMPDAFVLTATCSETSVSTSAGVFRNSSDGCMAPREV